MDMALALLLFEAGARVGLRWLSRNRWLLATCLAEAALGALAVWAVARAMGVPQGVAVPLALIAMAVSPVVVQRVVGECRAAGQVSERLLALATLNTLVAIVAVQLWSLGVDLAAPDRWWQAVPAALVSFLGSLMLGAALGEGIALIARRLDLRDDHAAVLVLGCVLLALVVAKTLTLSTLLVPLLAGLWLRNRSERPWVWPRHFGSAGSALVLVLFIATAAAPSPAVLLASGVVAVVLVIARFVAKAAVVTALAAPSGLSMRQGLALSAGLLPLSATAWVMGLEVAARHPELAAALLPLLLAMMFMVEIAAPVLMRTALHWVGEVDTSRAPAPVPPTPGLAGGVDEPAAPPAAHPAVVRR
jgi:NhaP-type Na+/H+ or K+/H+ antiporter